MPVRDRLYISVHNRALLEKIDDILKPSHNNLERKEIFFIAMALGLDTPEEIKGKKDGLFLLKNLRDNEINLLNVCAWHHYHDVDILSDTNKVFDIAEQCANAGFKLIELAVKNHGESFIIKLMTDTQNRFK